MQRLVEEFTMKDQTRRTFIKCATIGAGLCCPFLSQCAKNEEINDKSVEKDYSQFSYCGLECNNCDLYKATQTNNTYSVAASGTGYVVTGAIGDLGVDATDFNTNVVKRIYLNGVRQQKGSQVIWQSPTTFQYNGVVHSNNIFEVIT